MSCSHSLRTCPSCEVATKEADRKWAEREKRIAHARYLADLAVHHALNGKAIFAALYAREAAHAYFEAERIIR